MSKLHKRKHNKHKPIDPLRDIPVMVNGMVFESILDAARTLHISTKVIEFRLEENRVGYRHIKDNENLKALIKLRKDRSLE